MTSVASFSVGEPAGHWVVFASLAILLITLATIIYLVANEKEYWIAFTVFASFCILMTGGLYAFGYYRSKVGFSDVGVSPHAPTESFMAPKADVPPSVASIFEGPDN